MKKGSAVCRPPGTIAGLLPATYVFPSRNMILQLIHALMVDPALALSATTVNLTESPSTLSTSSASNQTASSETTTVPAKTTKEEDDFVSLPAALVAFVFMLCAAAQLVLFCRNRYKRSYWRWGQTVLFFYRCFIKKR